MLQWIIIIFVMPIVHHALLKWIPYRWVIASILFPFNILALWIMYKRRLPYERERALQSFQLSNHWTKKYWFGKSYEIFLLRTFF